MIMILLMKGISKQEKVLLMLVFRGEVIPMFSLLTTKLKALEESVWLGKWVPILKWQKGRHEQITK